MSTDIDLAQSHRVRERAALYRKQDPSFAQWAAGYGVISHNDLTQVRVYEMADYLKIRGRVQDVAEVFQILAAADRIASAAMWLVVHMTYARSVYIDGRDLAVDDFKLHPEGHTGGSLNMVPAYVGYLAINALTGITRSWLMGQGHCVAAIDSTNLIVGNMTSAHAERYSLSDEGLTKFVRDFYSYAVRPDGSPESPLGSHVNAHTSGGLMEGGYLGFAELYYVHMPLPRERLVVFLSDGAFEEQRGSDFVPRWWRGEDTGLVAPIMIANGRRIDQRTTMAQVGGIAWLRDHLRLNGFDPTMLDGRDPASYAWGIFEMEERLESYSHAVKDGHAGYPVPLPYGIAEAPKGFGFPGEGTNLAHNLPIGPNPTGDAEARHSFNTGGRRLWVPLPELERSIETLNNHGQPKRVRERDHALAQRNVQLPDLPEPQWQKPSEDSFVSPMEGLDSYFCRVIQENPGLRPRLGNPDELRSNRMNATLDLLKHRVSAPEADVAEAVDGNVITALNEEAVVCAALANKGGINLVVTYEAFAVKMLGAIRQEVIFTRHQREAGREPGWLSVPILLSSHTWENGKNEQSHQDPTLCETLMGEMSDVSRVLFPADSNTAVAAMRKAYSTYGQIWTMVVPKGMLPVHFTPKQSEELVETGAVRLRGSGQADEKVLLVAVGAYQLGEALRASNRLAERGIPHGLIYILEPGRFRAPRDSREAKFTVDHDVRDRLFPSTSNVRIFLGHMRPESLLGVIRPLDTGRERTKVLGYINQGGTHNVAGMLFANRCTWAHALLTVADSLELTPEEILTIEEIKAAKGDGNPTVVMH